MSAPNLGRYTSTAAEDFKSHDRTQECLQQLDALHNNPIKIKTKQPHLVPGVEELRQSALLDLQLRQQHILVLTATQHNAPANARTGSQRTGSSSIPLQSPGSIQPSSVIAIRINLINVTRTCHQ
ncbi:hypothetical protein B0H13DRAFT_1850270 [Mycena leptocephala]|nr:hypothetical protein B0H13DRAFT_1850270 [Mycena leptocephala]